MDLFIFHCCLGAINQWATFKPEGDFDLVELKKEINGNVFYVLWSRGRLSSRLSGVMGDRSTPRACIHGIKSEAGVSLHAEWEPNQRDNVDSVLFKSHQNLSVPPIFKYFKWCPQIFQKKPTLDVFRKPRKINQPRWVEFLKCFAISFVLMLQLPLPSFLN